MILALDVGNTNIHLGLFGEEKLLNQWRFSTNYAQTADELGLLINQFVQGEGFFPKDIRSVAVACVVPTAYSVIKSGISRFFNREVFFIDPCRHNTMPVLYENVSEIGADRLANSVAGASLVGCPLIVVDFGTATTFDVISPQGEYLGGSIAPGIEISIGALFAKAARLPRVDLVAPGRIVGRNTQESMQSGIIHGYAGLVDHLNQLIWEELDQKTSIVATGGLADIIVPHTKTVQRIEPTLTLQGIHLIYLKNEARELS